MRYEDVKEMEEIPFDEDVLGELCSPAYASPMLPDVYAVLILRYYRKYDEQYGTDLTAKAKIPQLIPGRNDEYGEDTAWLEEMPDVMEKAMLASGWDVVWISTESEELREAIEGMEDAEAAKKNFHYAYTKYLNELLADGFAKSCFMKEEETAMEATGYLEDGQLGIMWNEKLQRYMRYRTEKKDMVAALCPEEDRYIEMLNEDVWEPYMITYVQDAVEYGGEEYRGRKYCRIALGSDGYNYCWYDSINPNWICSAIKLGRMLDLALERLERYEKGKEKEAA
ncbi:MAG TPA: hypothetical protein DCZ91_25715 [Lachnospiraceae bacterium]|nr:hypothetical protein [Lachnospiraceae bacterium]